MVKRIARPEPMGALPPLLPGCWLVDWLWPFAGGAGGPWAESGVLITSMIIIANADGKWGDSFFIMVIEV